MKFWAKNEIIYYTQSKASLHIFELLFQSLKSIFSSIACRLGEEPKLSRIQGKNGINTEEIFDTPRKIFHKEVMFLMNLLDVPKDFQLFVEALQPCKTLKFQFMSNLS